MSRSRLGSFALLLLLGAAGCGDDLVRLWDQAGARPFRYSPASAPPDATRVSGPSGLPVSARDGRGRSLSVVITVPFLLVLTCGRRRITPAAC